MGENKFNVCSRCGSANPISARYCYQCGFEMKSPEAPVVALPAWLQRETGTLKGVVTRLPERSDIDYEVAEHLIVELYSK